MPRLEEGQIMPQGKFKKRRAWIQPEEVLPVISAPEALTVPKIKLDSTQTISSLEPDHIQSKTRLEHDYNNTITREKHTLPHNKATESIPNSKPKQSNNKNEIRIKQDNNKSITKLKHEYNNSASIDINNLIYFLTQQKTLLDVFEFSDPRYLVLSLSDGQRKIFWHTALQCIKRGTSRTGPIEIKSFFEVLGISIPVVRTSLNRLVEKGLLQRERGKLGKNGFAIISLPKMIFDTAERLVQEYNSSLFVDHEKRDSGNKAPVI